MQAVLGEAQIEGDRPAHRRAGDFVGSAAENVLGGDIGAGDGADHLLGDHPIHIAGQRRPRGLQIAVGEIGVGELAIEEPGGEVLIGSQAVMRGEAVEPLGRGFGAEVQQVRGIG